MTAYGVAVAIMIGAATVATIFAPPLGVLVILAEHAAMLDRRGNLGKIVGVIRWEQFGPYSKPVPWMAGQL